jgi:hypothetical protein
MANMASAIELMIVDFRGKLDGQWAALESARTRAAVALATSGVVAGLVLPSRVGHHLHGWVALGVLAMALTVICALEVMRPHKLTLWPEGKNRLDWFHQYQAYIEQHPQVDNSAELFMPQMAEDMVKWYEQNRGKLRWEQRFLTVAFFGVALQFFFWGQVLFH